MNPAKSTHGTFRRYTLFFVIGTFILISTVYYFFWHLRPFTQNAFVFANSRVVTPLVDGYIDEIYVRNNQFVRKGEPLFRTYPVPYESKVKQLQAAIESQQARLRQLAAQIQAAQATVRKLDADVRNSEYLSRQADTMYSTETVSQRYAEEKKRTLQANIAAYDNTRFSVKALEAESDAAGRQLVNLQEQLKLAKVYLEQTTVRAFSDGYVVSMTMAPGGYYEAGAVLFAFLDTSEWFVQANFMESELSRTKPGLKVRLWLRQYPGRVFSGITGDPGYAAERREKASDTGLPIVEPENEWFLLPQRFPVQIKILDPPKDLHLHAGGSVYAELETESHPIRQFFWELFLR